MNRFAVILFLSALFFLGASAQSIDPATGHCYQLFTTPLNFSSALTFAAAQTSASGFPGYLVTVTSTQEHDFVAALINSSANPFIDYYTAGGADAAGAFVWLAGPEDGQNIANSTQCLQSVCFFSTSVTYAPGQAITYINNTWSSVSESLAEAFVVEYDNCVASSTPTATMSPSNPTTTTTTSTSASSSSTTGASVTPSNFRPTITLGTLATTSSTTGKKATTGRRATSSSTTGRRGSTTGKVSAASSMTFSAVSVAIAAVTMLFLRR